jgi:hypothetical protein
MSCWILVNFIRQQIFNNIMARTSYFLIRWWYLFCTQGFQFQEKFCKAEHDSFGTPGTDWDFSQNWGFLAWFTSAFIFTDNVTLLSLSCNVKKSKTTAWLPEKSRNEHSDRFQSCPLSGHSSTWIKYQKSFIRFIDFHTVLCWLL